MLNFTQLHPLSRAAAPAMPARVLDWLAVALLCLAAQARAGCSREIIVPLAPIGMGVVVEGERISGIFPDLLTTVASRTGCRFKMSVVPQARLEALFELGGADLMMPAIGTSRRDRFGEFVPLMASRATLLSVDAQRAPVTDLKQLLERKELRVAVVRGNDYGESYRAVLVELARQDRLYFEPDPLHVARLLGRGMADLTIMTPMSLAYAMREDAGARPLLEKLRIEEVPELPWRNSGVYLSTRSLSEQDRRLLAAQLRDNFNIDAVLAGFRRTYPANVVATSQRPR
jgi:polar amino acid transport system substrate-binding protein